MNDMVLLTEVIPRPGSNAHAGHALDLLYAGRSEQTVRAYRQDMAEFAKWFGADAHTAITKILGGCAGDANMLILRWRADLLLLGLSPATINRRLAALKSVLKIAKTIGIVDWSIEVKGVKGEAYRDTRGTTLDQTQTIITIASKGEGAIGPRNVALVRMMYDCALRRNEVASLDVADFDGSRVMVLGKGKREKVPVTLPEPTRAAIQAWLDVSGRVNGPLFVHIDRHGRQHERLTGSGVYYVVTTLASEAGITARPHGLRHAAITRALDLSKGDYRAVKAFSRHAKVETVVRYDDNRSDKAGEIAALVANTIARDQ